MTVDKGLAQAVEMSLSGGRIRHFRVHLPGFSGRMYMCEIPLGVELSPRGWEPVTPNNGVAPVDLPPIVDCITCEERLGG